MIIICSYFYEQNITNDQQHFHELENCQCDNTNINEKPTESDTIHTTENFKLEGPPDKIP